MSAVRVSPMENVWAKDKHACYFCSPGMYPEMPDEHTLCARCGTLIETPGVQDRRNLAMTVCPRCEEEIGGES